MRKLKAPEGCGSVSFSGMELTVEDGYIEVPESAVAELVNSHGFTHPAPVQKGRKPKTGIASDATATGDGGIADAVAE